MDRNEKKNPKIKECIPTQPNEVSTESTGNAQDELVFFGTRDQDETTEEEPW